MGERGALSESACERGRDTGDFILVIFRITAIFCRVQGGVGCKTEGCMPSIMLETTSSNGYIWWGGGH